MSAASNNNTAVWLHSCFSSNGCQFKDNLFGNLRVSVVEKLSNSKYLSEKKKLRIGNQMSLDATSARPQIKTNRELVGYKLTALCRTKMATSSS